MERARIIILRRPTNIPKDWSTRERDAKQILVLRIAYFYNDDGKALITDRNLTYAGQGRAIDGLSGIEKYFSMFIDPSIPSAYHEIDDHDGWSYRFISLHQ